MTDSHGLRHFEGRAKQFLKLFAPLAVSLLLLCSPAAGQNRANVNIDFDKALGSLTDTSVGLLAATSDSKSFDPELLPYLRAAGIRSLRYPGSPGIADLYHWSTNTLVIKKDGAAPSLLAPGTDFGRFALFAEQLGQPVIVVNYGTNYDGSGSGEPLEAAAWVAYANGDPANSHELGKDSTGKDWHTVGYWAKLRGETPLANNDGLNFLRLNHPKPFGFKLWQIGDEPYNNGYPGGDQTGNPNLYGPPILGQPYAEKLMRTVALSPDSYAHKLAVFAKAMKAVDPSIQIGAGLTIRPFPGTNVKVSDQDIWLQRNLASWSQEVLKSACESFDFVVLPWFLQPLRVSDRHLNEPYLLDNVNLNLANPVHTTSARELADKGYGTFDDPSTSLAFIQYGLSRATSGYCPKDHFVRVAFAPAGIADWIKVDHPVVEALWVADFYAFLIESQVMSTDWSDGRERHGTSMLSADRNKFGPAYYGLQMLHIVAYAPGDLFLDVKSSSALVGAHATYRQDGYTGIMLVNKDPKYAVTVKVTLKHGSIGASGKRFDYGNAQYAAGQPVAVSEFSASGDDFTVSIPPYTITDILLPGHQ